MFYVERSTLGAVCHRLITLHIVLLSSVGIYYLVLFTVRITFVNFAFIRFLFNREAHYYNYYLLLAW